MGNSGISVRQVILLLSQEKPYLLGCSSSFGLQLYFFSQGLLMAHQKYLKQYQIKLIFLLIILPYRDSNEMIKISSIFPKKESKREIAVQTQTLLPKILGSWRKYRLPIDSSKHSSSKYEQEERRQFRESGQLNLVKRNGCKSVVFSSKFAKKKAEGWKENLNMLRESSKIQAKQFKFLKMEDILLKQTIVGYLENRILSKNQSKKINEKIKITYVFRSKQPLHDENIKESCFLNNFSIPEECEEYISVKQIIDKIKQAYGRLNMMCRDKGNLSHVWSNKKIAQLSQMFIQNKGKIVNQETRNQGKSNKVYLLQHLQKFIKNNDLKELYTDEGTNKQKLMNFYEQIYNRYESIPFAEEFAENQSQQQQSQKPSSKVHQNSSNTHNAPLPILKKQKSDNDPFIKLKFYNNLRKQIQNLAEDTDKILSEQGNKMPND